MRVQRIDGLALTASKFFIICPCFTYFIVIFQNFSTYITSPGKLSHDEAIDYCLSQHSAGLVTWDSDDKYQDVKYIVGRNGKDEEALTALHNPNKEECTPSAPCGANRKLVRNSLASSGKDGC